MFSSGIYDSKKNVFIRYLWLRHWIGEVGCGVAWALFWALFWVVLLFWALFWALKRVKPLKNVLSRVSMLFWALKKGLKRADLLKRVLNWEVLLKRGLNWVGHSKKCQREESRKKQEAVLRQEIKDVSISKHGWQGEQDYHRWTLINLKHLSAIYQRLVVAGGVFFFYWIWAWGKRLVEWG